MSIANIVFRLTFNKKKAILKIQKSVVESPGLWSVITENLCDSLDEIQKMRLIKICDILQESIDRHLKYLYKNKISQAQLLDNFFYAFRSYYELTVFYASIIIKYLRDTRNEEKVIDMLKQVLLFTFDAFQIRHEGEFGLFHHLSSVRGMSAFDQRIEMYNNFAKLYFSPRENEVEVYCALYDFLIVNPLKKESYSFNDFDCFSTVMTFQFDEGLPLFLEYLSKSSTILLTDLSKIN